jgi:hypothetical protein
MFPRELGLALNRPENSWVDPVLADPACLHFTLFIVKAYLDIVQGQREPSKAAQFHLGRCLNILQRRLAECDQQVSTSDSTVLVVLGLTVAAIALGDYEAARKHLTGLDRMVHLRGGLAALNRNRLLQTKICR